MLNAYMGAYKGPQTGTITVKADSGLLVLQAGNNTFSVYPEAVNLFFIKERDLTFEFVKGSNNKVQKMVMRENGDIVEEAVFVR